MSDDKSKVTDKASEIAKNIWLAGVGAYGRAVDEAQDRMEKAGVETPKLFKDLVEAGTALEEEARDSLEAARSARHSVEERINRVRENFNLQRTVRHEDLERLSDKIDLLSAKLDVLANALTDQGILQVPASKTRRPGAKRKPAAKAKARAAKNKAAATSNKASAAQTKVKAKAKTKAKASRAKSPARKKTAARKTGA